MVEPSSLDDYILLVCVGPPQHFAQVIEVFGVPHSNYDVARPHSEGFVLGLFVTINAELIKALRLPGPLFRYAPLGIGKERKENQAECNPTDGLLICREEV